MDAWSGCLASKAPAAAPRATSSATSEVERWHANPLLAAATTDVALTIKTSRAWCCSMAAAERPRMRRRNCGRSSSRRARRAWASGAEGMMMIELPRDTLCVLHADSGPCASPSDNLRLLSATAESSITLLNFYPGKIWVGRFRNFDVADIGKDIGGDVGRDIMREWRERLVLVGALDGNAEAPGVKRCATLGTNDDVQFCLFGGEIAERRNAAGEGHFYLPPAFTAQERDGNVRHLKATTIVRSPFSAPDQLLSLLHGFLQASRIRSDVEGCRLHECHSIRGVSRPSCCLRKHRHRNASRKPDECRATR